jgi:PIN domain nuclease of toxin-antitoxin system
VRVLLDTHVAIWWFDDPARLDIHARATLEDPETTAFLSAASVWEAATKAASGRLVLPTPLPDAARRTGVLELAVGWEHAQCAAALAPIHRDPFDRFLVAQAITENLVLVTRDAVLARYPVATMPA